MTDSETIDAKIDSLPDWRGKALARVRELIRQADPQVIEEVKWRKASNPLGVPTWSHDGIICTGETYRDKIKLTFAKGASIDDPAGLFNSSLDGGTRRAIDIREGETIDADAFRALDRHLSSLPRAGTDDSRARRLRRRSAPTTARWAAPQPTRHRRLRVSRAGRPRAREAPLVCP